MLFILVIIALLGLVAMAMDLCYVMHLRNEAQRSADAAALAGAWGLIHPDRFKPVPDATQAIIDARTGAVYYAKKNAIGIDENHEIVFPDVDRNEANVADGEIVVSHLPSWSYPPVYPWDDSGNANYLWSFLNTNKYNTVCVRVQRSEARNGPVPLYFGKIFGMPSLDVHTAATAIIEWGQPIGFRPTSQTGNAPLMPFAVHYMDYRNAYAGSQSNELPPIDQYYYYPDREGAARVVEGESDGITEFDLYPALGPGWTGEGEGNFGTVDLGGYDNSSSEIVRQISYGVTPEDLAEWGGEFVIENAGYDDLAVPEQLNGDTGLSAGMKEELAAIIGETRAILLYREVENPGNNAMFEIIDMVGVVILDVKLTGMPKWLRVQPAPVVTGT
ncbi:MAG: pilus assembly protein TadG-related protein, partial [Planctomycetota bacterium]